MGRRKIAEDATAIAARRQKVGGMYLSGRTQFDIAGELGVSQATVSADLAAIRKEWMRAAASHFAARVAHELARVDNLESEAWAAWRRSQNPAETTTTEKGEEAGGLRGVKTVKMRAGRKQVGRDGNPEFLRVVERCLIRRAELLGLDAPKPKGEEAGGQGASGAGVPVELVARLLAAVGARQPDAGGPGGPAGGNPVEPQGGVAEPGVPE